MRKFLQKFMIFFLFLFCAEKKVPYVDTIDYGPEEEVIDIAEISPDYFDAEGDYFELEKFEEIESDIETPESQLGKPCKSNEDCLSGFCLQINGESVCTIQCVEECPKENWVCKTIPWTHDPMTLCVPKESVICKECKTHQDCEGENNYCIAIGNTGKYCSSKCEKNEDCPLHYNCVEIEIENAETLKLCYPETQSCVCTYELNGKTEPCFIENEYGKCFGEKLCDGPNGWTECSAKTPTPEICDGFDNDCDGEFDEDLASNDCEITNEFGTCIGKNVCKGKEGWKCEGKTPEKEECDGEDNNCDEKIDEGFDNTDGDTKADCIDEDIDGDEILNEDDNCPKIFNKDQKDLDIDGKGDLCDEDKDGDGILNEKDNCPEIFNHKQYDIDKDGLGNECPKSVNKIMKN